MRGEARGAWSAAGAVISVLLATGCCLPLAPFAIAAGVAGLASVLAGLRPRLMGLAVALLGFGFWQAYGRRSCAARARWWQRAVLWLSLLFVGVFLAVPQQAANWLAGVRSGPAPQAALLSVDELRGRFNAAADKLRLLAIFSPT